ncbi:Dephospho-CoA kinase [hydrothermal vent metagenome]|uniref:Dephospho-CoA kinase n=1 Tax=hydrothermal vent metagenome TaxID=652676 RepID=A0A3B1BDL2_9ZZZZ
MPLVGVTGGYATGKSFVSRSFSELGAKLIDCDQLAREVVKPGTEGLKLVVNAFGDDILGPNGSIDRSALGKIVFSDPEKRKTLESILHPIIIGIALQRAKRELAHDPGGLVVVEAALLFESGLFRKMEKNIAVVCGEAEQVSRGMARDKLPEDDVRARIEAQWPLDRKKELADFVIDNGGSKENTQREVKRLFDKIAS